MNENSSGISCPIGCWLVALLASILLAALLVLVGGFGFTAAIFLSLIFFVLGGTLLTYMMCSGSAAASSAATGSSATAAAATASTGQDSAVASGEITSSGAETASAAAPAASTAASASAAASVKSGTTLAGEDELASRKGDWKYEGEAAKPAKKAAAKKAPAKKKAAPKKAADAGVDYDGDGVVEGANEGTRPEALDGPRDGKADDLKKIKGVGPKMEKLCNSLGFYHFDQIASWNADEVAWVDANLEGFKGRVTRDTWVEQATLLAAGKDTAFSKKVDKGGVY